MSPFQMATAKRNYQRKGRKTLSVSALERCDGDNHDGDDDEEEEEETDDELVSSGEVVEHYPSTHPPPSSYYSTSFNPATKLHVNLYLLC